MSLLEIKNLNVRFGDASAVPVVDGLNLSVDKGEVLAIVGESGSGKSVTMMALMGLIDAPGIVTADALNFDGHNMLSLSARQRRQIVGKDMAMVFQDPMTALNPSYTVGFQIEEVLRLHLNMSKKQARQRAIELLEKVEIPAAASLEERTAAFEKSLDAIKDPQLKDAVADLGGHAAAGMRAERTGQRNHPRRQNPGYRHWRRQRHPRTSNQSVSCQL